MDYLSEAIMNQANSSVRELDLSYFTGSERFVRHTIVKSVILSEGAAYLTEKGAAWLIDIIAIAQTNPAVSVEPFQSWTLTVNEDDHSARISATDGGAEEDEDDEPIYRTLYFQKIPFTDFPLKSVTLYCCSNGEEINGKTICLASEY